jgi:GT2 family glycosyltransferase
MSDVSVAIPTRNGGQSLERTLQVLARQTVEHELIVCDTASTDGSGDLARRRGARVIEIGRAEFGHGRTRNLLMREAQGARVAFLSQDAEPAGERWLESMLGGFELGEDVAIVYGPYRARPEAALAVRLELERWFASLSPDGEPTVERLGEGQRDLPPSAFLGRRGFFTDANACLRRDAWEQVPFRDVPYAEDRMLAMDMLRAGYAKAYVPGAAVIHSHHMRLVEQLRRSFDEWRALAEVYGWREPAAPAHLAGQIRGELGYARRRLRSEDRGLGALAPALVGVGLHHAARLAGAVLGSRADSLPAALRGRISLERRNGTEAQKGAGA